METKKWLEEGNNWFYKKDYQKAMEFFDKVIELDKACSNKRIALYSLGKYQEAMKYYNIVIEMEKDFSSAYTSKGIVLSVLGKYQKAMEYYDKAIGLDKNNINAYYNKGKMLYDFGKYGEAIECYDKAIELNKYLADVYNDKGVALKNLGKYEEAMKCYDKAIELNSKYKYITYDNKGYLLYIFGKYQESIECYDKAINLKNNYVSAYYNKGFVLYRLYEYQEALKYFNIAIDLDTNCAIAYYGRGNVYAYLLNNNIKVEGLNIDKNSTYTDYNTYLYLSINKKKIDGMCISPLISFYDELYPQTILNILENSNSDIGSFLSLYNKLTKALQSVEDFEILLNYYKLHITDKYKFWGIQSILYYHLGGSVAAYKIFDEELDTENDYQLSPQELYYFALTAFEINTKVSGAEAIIQNGIDIIKKQETIDFYYLGHLYLLQDDDENAKLCFEQSDDHFSKIMLVYLTKEDTSDLEKIDITNVSDIDYTSEDLSKFQDYFHYNECINAISEENFINQPLWEVFKLSEADKHILEKEIRKKENEIIKKELLQKFETINVSIEAKDLLKEILEDIDRLEQYEKLKGKIDFAKKEAEEKNIEDHNIEKLLGSIIKQMGTNAEDCMYFIYYCYMQFDKKKNKRIISSEQAFDLMLYLRHTIDESKFSQIMKEIANLGIMTIPWADKLEKGFQIGILAYQSIYRDCRFDDDKKQLSDYESFKQDLWKIIPTINNKFLDEIEKKSGNQVM